MSLQARGRIKDARAATALYLAGVDVPKTIAEIEAAIGYTRLAGVLLRMHTGGLLDRHTSARPTDIRYSLAKPKK